MKEIFFIASSLLLAVQSFSQDFLSKNEYFYSLTNRLNLLAIRDSAQKNISLGISFQCGSFKERDGFNGLSYLFEQIISRRVTDELNKNIPAAAEDSSLFSISGNTTYEIVSLRLSFPKNYLEQVLKILYSAVTLPFSPDELRSAADYSNMMFENIFADPSASAARKTGLLLWEDDFQKRTIIYPWNDSMMATLPGQMAKLRAEYFCPRNCMIVIRGNIVQKTAYDMVNAIFKNWERCTINPLTRFPAPNYRSALHSAQLVDEHPLSNPPFFTVAFPGPNTFEDKRSNYAALVLAAIISGPGTKTYSMLHDSCGTESVVLQNDLAKYISQMTFKIIPGEDLIGNSYECFQSFLTGGGDSILDDGEVTAGIESVISEFNKRKSDELESITQVIKFWTSVSLNDYSTFEDSIRTVTAADIRNLIKKYFHGRPYVAALSITPELRKSTGIDRIFTPVNEDIRSYRIHFLKNSAFFSEPADDSTLNSLIQFMKINPAISIKVNGVCHKDELLDVSDKDMTAWIRSLGTEVIINPPSLAKKKKYRLDVYRSLTLIRKLNEAGIDRKRLFGTGNLVKNPGETEQYQYAHFSEVVN